MSRRKNSEFESISAASESDESLRNQCEAFKATAISQSRVQFLTNALSKAGCPVDMDKLVQCVHCDQEVAGTFLIEKDKPVVYACANHIKRQWQFNDMLAHEMVHAYDTCTTTVDVNNCQQHACAEVSVLERV